VNLVQQDATIQDMLVRVLVPKCVSWKASDTAQTVASPAVSLANYSCPEFLAPQTISPNDCHDAGSLSGTQ
jgi:hypothetical protein